MAKPTSQTITGVATGGPVWLDYQTSAPFNVSLWVKVGAGCTYTLEFTCEANTGTPTFWIAHASATALTVDCAVSIAFPATAVRCRQTVGAAASTFTVIQQGVV